MKKLARKICSFLLLPLLAASVSAQTSVSEIIENSLQALGGRKAIAEVRSLQAIADCRGPNGDYRTEIYSATGGRLVFAQSRANGKAFLGQTNGQTFWTKDEKSGDFLLAEASAAAVWRGHDFQFMAIEIDRRFREFSFAAEENFAGKSALKLTATDESGNPASVFFDKKTRLLLGFLIPNPFDKSETIRTVFSEWRQVGRLKLPSKVTATDKQGDFVLNFTEIVLNKTGDKFFAVPLKVAAMRELLELQKQARVAHFTRNAKLLVSTFADDFTSVSGGKIGKPSREKSLARFQEYLDSSTFIEWDDIAPPVIKVSDDATLGYVLVHKKVRLTAKNAAGKEEEETEIFAWIETYQKIKGEWKLTAVVSTNTPEKD